MAKVVSKFSILHDQVLSLDGDLVWRSMREWLKERTAFVFTVASLGLLGLLLMGYWRYQKATVIESLRLGVVALQNKEFDKAIKHLQYLRGARSGKPEQVVGLLHLGDAYAGIGNEVEANKAYEDAITIISQSESDNYLQQILLLKGGSDNEKKGNLKKATSQYEKAAELDGPLKVESLASFARVMEAVKDVDKAKANYGKAASVAGTHPLAEIFVEKSGK